MTRNFGIASCFGVHVVLRFAIEIVRRLTPCPWSPRVLGEAPVPLHHNLSGSLARRGGCERHETCILGSHNLTLCICESNAARITPPVSCFEEMPRLHFWFPLYLELLPGTFEVRIGQETGLLVTAHAMSPGVSCAQVETRPGASSAFEGTTVISPPSINSSPSDSVP